MTECTKEGWEIRFDNGVALKIGKAGRSEGVTNVRHEVKQFIRETIASDRASLVKAVEGLRVDEGRVEFDGTGLGEMARNQALAEVLTLLTKDISGEEVTK